MTVKITDFGFSEKLYMKLYVRMVAGGTVKLPVKWMAPENINFGVFSEKSDVVRDILFSVHHPLIITPLPYRLSGLSFNSVVIWCDLLGNFHRRCSALSWDTLICHTKYAHE